MLQKSLFAALFAALFAGVLPAQTYTPDVNDSSAWSVTKDDDSMIDFGWDYSALGIPPAPGGSDTTGIRMAANIVGPNAAMISASPNGVAPTAPYTMTFDFWINYNTSGGTTEFAGAHIGFNPDMADPFNGVGLIGDSDGDSARDIRFYVDNVEKRTTDDPNYYSIASNNHTDEPLVSTFVGQSIPAAQGEAPFDPTNTIVPVPDGSLGFAWRQMTIDVTDNEAVFLIDDLEIGRVPADQGIEGNVALSFGDIFPSVSTKPEFSFGVFDNLSVVQVPEPAGLSLAVFTILGLLGIRRRSS